MAKNDRRRFGDRKDGRLLRSLPAYTTFTPYIMATRNDALNLYEESMEVTEVDRRLRRLRVDLCMLCGCCSYVCPAKRPLAETNALAKTFLRKEAGQ